MKKLFMLVLLAVFGMAGEVKAATDTPTNTPTFTPTFTPTPVFVKDSDRIRANMRMIFPEMLMMDDGVTRLTATSQVGSAGVPYLAQRQNMTVARFLTGTTTARFKLVLPNNYNKAMPLNLWVYGATTATSNATCSMVVNAYRMPLNGLTSSAGTWLGVTKNVMAWNPVTYTTGVKNILRDSRVSYFPLPMPASITQAAAGDILSFQVIRAAAAAAGEREVDIYAIEPDWKPLLPKNP